MMVCRDENELFDNFSWDIEYENENLKFNYYLNILRRN
jgi:hypothetical protein